MYRASFRAEWLQRFGVGSCNCVGFGWANGGMGFGEVAQANGARKSPWPWGQSELVVAQRPQPEDRREKRGWKASLLSPVEEPQGVCAVRRAKM